MKVIKPPLKETPSSKKKIFLAGSIEMGKAIDWQTEVIEKLKDLDVTFYNPRRDDWDSSWKQTIDHPEFKEQVLWELDHIELADIVVFYFQPETISPITLLELGLYSQLKKPALVCCPDGFHRKGNVDIVCEKYNLTRVENLESLIAQLRVLCK